MPFSMHILGKQVDYNQTAFGAMVVSHRMAESIADIAPGDVQRIPAIIDAAEGSWEVFNVLTCMDCIDHRRSVIHYSLLSGEPPRVPG